MHHDLAGARRPAPFAFDVFKALEEAADVEQHSGEFRSDCVERAAQPFACRDAHREGRRRSARARPCAMEASQIEVTRGVSCARVKSPRKRSPACNCTTWMSGWPSRPLRRASQASGLSGSSIATSAKPCGVSTSRRVSAQMLRAEGIDRPAGGNPPLRQIAISVCSRRGSVVAGKSRRSTCSRSASAASRRGFSPGGLR